MVIAEVMENGGGYNDIERLMRKIRGSEIGGHSLDGAGIHACDPFRRPIKHRFAEIVEYNVEVVTVDLSEFEGVVTGSASYVEHVLNR